MHRPPIYLEQSLDLFHTNSHLLRPPDGVNAAPIGERVHFSDELKARGQTDSIRDRTSIIWQEVAVTSKWQELN